MRKYNIFVKFEIGEEFKKLFYSFESIPEAIDGALDFITACNSARAAMGVSNKLTHSHWYILSDDEKIFINYEPEYNGYLVTDFDNLDNKAVYKY